MGGTSQGEATVYQKHRALLTRKWMYSQETKQLTFANGGWCMHDEAATHFMGMIDQTTLGHSFLKETFDYVPTVGWQLDPFGHSSTQSSLMTYKTGFDALFFGRIDYQDMELRHATKECEGLWNAGDSDSYGEGLIYRRAHITLWEAKAANEPPALLVSAVP